MLKTSTLYTTAHCVVWEVKYFNIYSSQESPGGARAIQCVCNMLPESGCSSAGRWLERWAADIDLLYLEAAASVLRGQKFIPSFFPIIFDSNRLPKKSNATDEGVGRGLCSGRHKLEFFTLSLCLFYITLFYLFVTLGALTKRTYFWSPNEINIHVVPLESRLLCC